MKKLFTLLFLSFMVSIGFEAHAQETPKTVTGTVVDVNSVPVLGANVIIEGTSIGATTDFDGKYSIKVPNSGSSLTFSYVGYATKTVEIDGKSVIDITLEASADGLDEVVIVAFGSQKKISVVGAVSTIAAEDLRTANTTISTSLAGNVAGIVGVQRTGQPGADGASFYIRGVATYSGVSNPLILLDGVEISQGDLNSLSPEVIESVSVLKDATATAVYGTRGANGVLIVATKTGKNLDKPRINVRLQSQFTTPTSTPEFVSGVDYMELYNEAVTQRKTGEILFSQDKIDGTREGLNQYVFPNVDWYDAMFNDFADNQEVNVNVQGGGKKVGYFMNATMNNQNGMLKKFDVNSYDNNINVRKFTFQNNIDAELSSTTKVALKLNTQLRYYNGPSSNVQSIFSSVMNTNPVVFPMFFPLEEGADPRDMMYGGKSGGTVNDGFENPFAKMTSGYNDNFQSTVLATFTGEQKLDFITEGLVFKGLASFKNWSTTTITRSKGYNQYEIGSYSVNPDGTYSYNLNQVGAAQSISLGTSTASSGDRRFYM